MKLLIYMSKSCVLLYNKDYGKHVLNVLHGKDIFDRINMANLIETIENKTYLYDDIFEINVNNMLDIASIDTLPDNLRKLNINTTTIKKLIIPPKCVHIEELIINRSNLSKLPDIAFLTKLKTLTITEANLKEIPHEFPPSLFNINFSKNSLSSTNTDINSFPKNSSVMLFNNKFTKTFANPERNILIVYGSQCNYKYKPITNYIIQNEENLNLLRQANRDGNMNQRYVYNADADGDYFVVQNNLTGTTDAPTLFDSSQTVHITSICDSVTKSIQIVKELTKDDYTILTEGVLINEMLEEFYPISKNIVECVTLDSNFLLEREVVLDWANDPTIHVKSQVRYSELLARIWILIKGHSLKKDFIENVKREFRDSIKMCFTGRINRLVNSLIGFIDGIVVGISIKEQLQLEIAKIIKKLTSKEITYDQCKNQINELFEDPDVKQDETVTEYYKQAWIDALEDYAPEDANENKNTIANENVVNNVL